MSQPESLFSREFFALNVVFFLSFCHIPQLEDDHIALAGIWED